MKLKELFDNNKTVLTDGAMGTWFSQLTGLSSSECEKYNVIDPHIIERIHKEYIGAGAKIIRTNTFSANSMLNGIDKVKLKDIIVNGYRIAKNCAKNDAVVCADVSALYYSPELMPDRETEYKYIIGCFLSEGAETFIFETLSSLDAVMPAIDHIVNTKPDAEIIVSFTLLPDRKTRSGLPMDQLLREIDANKNKLAAVGLNCGTGAAQLYNNAIPFFSYIQERTDLFTLVMPNAGYPSIINGRTVFNSAPSYFAQQTARFISHGISAVGGCCGTTPEYIRLLGEYLKKDPDIEINTVKYIPVQKKRSAFSSKLAGNDFILAAELDPPNNSDFTKLINSARILKDSGIDIITVSDSPLGHAKADPVICSARIMRETGVETLPHICCRDRNINAMRSILLGAHSEGIRAVLAVTGDHIAESDRGIVKPVFNLDSTKLMSLISDMNADVFSEDPVVIGGAFDPCAVNSEFPLKRLDKKISCGAKFILTQPVFSDKAIEQLKKAKEKNIKVLAGIMPMVSYRNACFMKNEVPGMVIPDELIERFSPDMTREQSQLVGIEIAAELAKKAMPFIDGIYFITPFNRADVIRQVIRMLDL